MKPYPPVPWPGILANVPAKLHECQLFPTLKDFCGDAVLAKKCMGSTRDTTVSIRNGTLTRLVLV